MSWSVIWTYRFNFKPSYDMKTPRQDQRDLHKRPIENARQRAIAPEPSKDSAHGRAAKSGAPESPGSRATIKQRTKKPRNVGLANEARPGLGTRGDDRARSSETPMKEAKSRSKPQATTHGYEEPRPEPREQASDSMAHEQERSTGVSGHSGNT
jgi:hypothetical protein